LDWALLHTGTNWQNPGDDNLLAFGASAGVAFLGAAILLALVRRRLVWVLLGLFDLLVTVFYFVVAPIRQPSSEMCWSLLIKVQQAVLLAAMGYLLVRGPQGRRHRAPARSSADVAEVARSHA
jgi:hypothetical protein